MTFESIPGIFSYWEQMFIFPQEQMKMKQEELERQKMKRDMELELLRRDREAENRKIQELLAEVKIDNEHPFRAMAKRIC